MIGIPDIAKNMWSNNTILVTYLTCESAGKNGEFFYNSLTYKTAEEGGAKLAIGFADIISYGSAERWSERFHSKLKAGAGVWDSMDYANSDVHFILLGNDSIRKCYLVRHDESVNDNMIINRYINSELNSIADTYSRDLRSDDNILKNKIEINKNEEDIVIDYLKQYDSEFDINNYYIGKSSMVSLCASNKEDVKQIDYIYVTLKIGDFYTDAGYVAKIKDNKIVAIYDNNIDVEKQKNAIANKEKFSVNTNSADTKSVKERALASSKLENVSANEDVKYYYDIKNDKKYVVVPIRSEIDDGMGGKDVFIDTVQYEI